jgi:hypothetical protein
MDMVFLLGLISAIVLMTVIVIGCASRMGNCSVESPKASPKAGTPADEEREQAD